MDEFASQEFIQNTCDKCSRYIKHKVIHKGKTKYLCNLHFKQFARGKKQHRIHGGNLGAGGDKGLTTVSSIGNYLVSRSGDTDVVQLRMKDLEKELALKRKEDIKIKDANILAVEEEKALWRAVAIMWKNMNPPKSRRKIIVSKFGAKFFRIHWGDKYILYSNQTNEFTNKTHWEPRMEVDRYNNLIRYI